jgi:hypothetical protein
MDIKNQFTVALENKPGVLAGLCDKLASQKVNILAMMVINTQEMGMVRMVLSNKTKGAMALSSYNCATEDVLMVSIPNRPGSLGKIARKLAAEKINIEYTYGSSGEDCGAMLAIKVPDCAKAKKALKKK